MVGQIWWVATKTVDNMIVEYKDGQYDSWVLEYNANKGGQYVIAEYNVDKGGQYQKDGLGC